MWQIYCFGRSKLRRGKIYRIYFPVGKGNGIGSKKIFSEWLPALKEYEFAAGYCIEMYDDASKYPKGTQDENYHSEIWIPVRKIK